MDFDADVAFGDAKAGWVLSSASPDLRSFRGRGGKIIQYHGWGDAAIPAYSSIECYENVRAFHTRFPDARSDTVHPVSDFYRLFIVSGMGHCGGGIGAINFGNGKIVATGVVPAEPSQPLSRPLCPYPEAARYNGTGDPNFAGNFVCAQRARYSNPIRSDGSKEKSPAHARRGCPGGAALAPPEPA